MAEVCSLDRYRRACEDARLFLEGRTDEVLRRLRAEMEGAAADERFEEAASLRDQLRTLERLETPQKITTTDIEERDLVGAHVEGERAALQVFSVRDGKVVSREGYLLDRLAEPEAVLSSALQQYYAQGRYVPREILVPERGPRPGAARGVALGAPRQRGPHPRARSAARRCGSSSWSCATPASPSTSSGSIPRRQSQEILRALRDLLDLEVEPRRIECFDISNIQGSDIVASMVCFVDGVPKKSDYRKFRVKSVTGGPDDFASMREVVGRRYQRLLEEGKDLPDLVLIDGGKGQLGAAVEALEELGLGEQPVASLAKKEELIFLRGRDAADRPAAHRRRCCSSCSASATRPTASPSASTARPEASARCARSSTTSPASGPPSAGSCSPASARVRGVRGASEAELATAVGKAVAARIRAHFADDPAG